MKEWYAIIRWSVDDVIAAAKTNNITLTKEQAAKWWEKNEHSFIDIMTEYGNEVLSNMNFDMGLNTLENKHTYDFLKSFVERCGSAVSTAKAFDNAMEKVITFEKEDNMKI